MSSPIPFLCFHSGPELFCKGLGHSAVFVCSRRWRGELVRGEQMGELPAKQLLLLSPQSLHSFLFVQNPESTTDQGGSCWRRVLMHPDASPILKWPGTMVAVLLQSAPVICSCVCRRAATLLGLVLGQLFSPADTCRIYLVLAPGQELEPWALRLKV